MAVTVASAPTSRARRTFRLGGTLLVVAGILAIAWGLVIWIWGDPVTSFYTSREQNRLERRYEDVQRTFAAATPAPSTTPTPAQVRKAATRFRGEVAPGSPLGRIRVPELGLNMMLVAGTDTDSLRKGPGWDARTFLPGEGELVYIAGHRTTFKAPFAHIDRLRAGHRVELELPYGRFTYVVTRSVIVPADDLARLDSRGREEVALQACHPRFSAKQRYIVYARPIRVS